MALLDLRATCAGFDGGFNVNLDSGARGSKSANKNYKTNGGTPGRPPAASVRKLNFVGAWPTANASVPSTQQQAHATQEHDDVKMGNM